MKRYILTGTPGSGKTSIILSLEIQGKTVVHEAATDVIAYKAMHSDMAPWEKIDFIDDIIRLQQQRQRVCCDHKDVVFYDRSPLCTYALAQYLGFEPSSLLLDEIDRIQDEAFYEKQVFFINQLGFIKNNGARKISYEDAARFEQIHLSVYRQFGYECKLIPAATIPARVEMILKML
ncbi:TPA: AAA family ATPase [Legionella pneumophila]